MRGASLPMAGGNTGGSAVKAMVHSEANPWHSRAAETMTMPEGSWSGRGCDAGTGGEASCRQQAREGFARAARAAATTKSGGVTRCTRAQASF